MRAGNLRHRSVAVVVVTGAGALVAHRRAGWKDVWPGRWDLCFGGVAAVGEGWEDAARRELAEEAGVAAAPADLALLGSGTYADDAVSAVYRIYAVTHDGPFTPADGEVAELVLVPLPRPGCVARRARPVRRRPGPGAAARAAHGPGAFPPAPRGRPGVTPMACTLGRRTVTPVSPGRRCSRTERVDDESRTVHTAGTGGAVGWRILDPARRSSVHGRGIAFPEPQLPPGSPGGSVGWEIACPATPPTSPRTGARSPSSATPTRARPPSPRSSCSTAGRCRRPVRSRPGASGAVPGPTGWSSSRSGASPSPPRCCSSPTATTCSTCSTRRATATSPRTRTGCWRRSTPRSWSSTPPRASRPRRSSCSRCAGPATCRCSPSSTSGTGPVATGWSCSTRSSPASTCSRCRSRGRSATRATSGG